jgi:quinol-cytochrome oxidoreductase complex cytochrome b subunit
MTNGASPNQDSNIAGRVWRSIFRGRLRPRDDADRKRIVLSHLVLHFRPVRLPTKNLRYTHTWGLGGSSLTLFSVLVATGLLMIFVYEPSPDTAYRSILTLQSELFFGKLIRSIHYWSANFLIVIVVLHLLRVYFTGAYYAARQFNWVLGLLLLLCVLASNFTGYLLPWDQLSYWAITIVTGMIGYVPLVGGWLQGVARGGPEIGPSTLVDYYAAHTTVLPALIIALSAFHFWRVRKAGGVVVPRSPEAPVDPAPQTALTLPHLLLRELAAALVLIAFIMTLALLFDAPLGDPANPGMSPNPAKAPWYFVGFQELLLHFDPIFAVVVIPLVAALGLFLLPYFKYAKDTSGIFMMSREGRRMAAAAAIIALAATPALIVVDEYWIDFRGWLPGLPPVVTSGLVPAVILFGAWLVFHHWLTRRFRASNNELIQTTFVLLAVIFVVLTITGVFFRGGGMALVWPWQR